MIREYHTAEDNWPVTFNLHTISAYKRSSLRMEHYNTVIILSGGEVFTVRESYETVTEHFNRYLQGIYFFPSETKTK